MSNDNLHLGFRFGVYFFANGTEPNPIDIRFQKVRGIEARVALRDQPEGGQNLYTQKLPAGIDYPNLVLERGLVVRSPLNLEFHAAMSLFKFQPSNVQVVLFSESKVPVTSWLFMKAYPVRWATSDLDAGEKSLVIDTLELAYSRMQVLRN